MNWYLVKLIFSLEPLKASDKVGRFEEQLRLVSEETHDLAILRGRRMGKTIESDSLKDSGSMEQRRFVDVKEVIAIAEWKDGVELESRRIEAADGESFINSVLLHSLRLSARTPVLF